MAEDSPPDSGSSSSSDSDTSSSSDSSADSVPLIYGDRTAWGAPGKSILLQRHEARAAREREEWNRTLLRIFAGEPKAPDEKETILQGIVERDRWFVPVRADGSYETVVAHDRQYGLAIGAGPNRREKGRQPPRGRGGRLLPLFDKDPGRPAVALDGRALVRSLSEQVDGLLLDPRGKKPRELIRDHFPDLLRRVEAYELAKQHDAAGLELEALLVTPGPDQVEPLKQATWWVNLDELERQAYRDYDTSARLVRVYTRPDRATGQAPAPLDGATLFRRLADDPTLDGVVVDLGTTLGQGEDAIHAILLSTGFAHHLLAGRDIRPGAQPLPARSRAEIELWLDLHDFPAQGRKLIEAPLPDNPLLVRARYEAGPHHWRIHETLKRPDPRSGRIWSPVFTLPPGGGPPDNLGDDPSQILCPGLLARELGAGGWPGRDPTRLRPGRWLGLGRLLSASDRARSMKRLLLAVELHKLLPPDADRIPSSAIRTVKGATTLREHPHARTRAWIEATIQQVARYTKPWVWFR